MPRAKTDAMLEKRRTALGRAVMADEEFCETLLDMRHSVDSWDGMGTGPKMDKIFDKHGIDLKQVVDRIKGRRLKGFGWTMDTDGEWQPPGQELTHE